MLQSFLAQCRINLILSRVEISHSVTVSHQVLPMSSLLVPSELSCSWLASKTIPSSSVVEEFEVSFDPQSSGRGALSECFKARLLARDVNNKLSVLNLFIKWLKVSHTLELSHLEKLFLREIVFYRDVYPRLLRFGRSRSPHFELRSLILPKFYFGEVGEGKGCIILDDLSAKNFDMCDPNLMLLTLNHMQVSMMALAEFHGLCLAFDLCHEAKLVDRYPILQSTESLWLQSSMQELLESNKREAADFLSSIPGEEETAKRFLHWVSDASRLVLSTESPDHAVSSLRCLQHGDVWHNNLIFRSVRGKLKVALIDWQVSVEGNCMSDLCFLFLSSTTRVLRAEHLHSLLRIYYETLKQVVSVDLAINNFDITFDTIMDHYVTMIPRTLYFCTNAEDFKQNSTGPGVDDREMRKLSIACDSDVHCLEQPLYKRPFFNARSVRRLRRRNFLDACKEALTMTTLY